MAGGANQTGLETPCSLRPLYYDFDGFRLSAAFNIDRYRSAISYKPKEGDIFIATFPKCGTTWLQEICYLILNDGVSPTSHMQRLMDTPFFEMLGAESVEQMRKPGAIKTHLPYHLIPYSPNAKYVCAIRNPKDCVVSFYYHTSKTYPGYNFCDGTFSEFFELFMEGKTDFGCYFEHVRSWLRQRHRDNIHTIYFEDVKTHGPEEILKLGRFLGDEYEAKLKAGVLEKVIEGSSIKKMKEDFSEFKIDMHDERLPKGLRQFAACNVACTASGPGVTGAPGSSDTVVEIKGQVRKGAINDWKNHFTSEQNARIEARILNEFDKEFPELVHKWREYGVFDELPVESGDR